MGSADPDLVSAFDQPPDPGDARSVDELVAALRLLKTWAGNPSYATITKRVNTSWLAAGRPPSDQTSKNTVADHFVVGRRRKANDDLLLGVVTALNPDSDYLNRWRSALRTVRGEAEAATIVDAQAALPDDLAEFTGREAELRRIATRLATARPTAAVSAIEGMAGIGKTRLAVQIGHHLLARGAVDLVLFVNLRGFHPDPAQPPADPEAVLISFLRLLGVSGEQIPSDPARRAALYRERLQGRKALVVLDNAGSTAQVEPLLPGCPMCPTLVTSRRTLAGLPGAEHTVLDVFTPAESLAYLRHTIGGERVDLEPDAAAGIAHAVGHLPLALSLTAARIATSAHADWVLADHLDVLTTRRRVLRLDSEVEGSVGLSYTDLPDGPRTVLRAMALHPGQDMDAHAAAALAGTDPATAQRHLNRLLADHLVLQKTAGRYELHDLVRGFLASRTVDEDRPMDRRAALGRLVDFYLHTACLAMDRLHPYERELRRRFAVAAAVTATPARYVAVPDRAAALRWLEVERPNLLAVATVRLSSVVAFSAVLHRYLLTAGHYLDAVQLHRRAIAVAGELADHDGQAFVLAGLGKVHERLGEYGRAIEQQRRALALSQTSGNLHGQAIALSNLGQVHERLGQRPAALDYHNQALHHFRALGDSLGQARTLGNLGMLHRYAGRLATSAEFTRQALRLFRAVGDQVGEATALDGLGNTYRDAGRSAQAVEHHRQAIAVFQEIGDRSGLAYALNGLGCAYYELGRYELAIETVDRAVTIFQEIGNRHGLLYALQDLAGAHLRIGRPDLATELHHQAMDLSTAVGDPAGQAISRRGLGDIALATGQPDNAREQWTQALRLYTELGAPEADQVAAQLAALTSRSSR